MDSSAINRDETSDEPGAKEQASRILARGLIISGGIFWMLASFAGPYVYQELSLATSLSVALWPLIAAAVILVMSWTYERLAAELLLGASTAVLVWGVLFAWEIGVWILMIGLLMVPMIVSGGLLLFAAHAAVKREEAIWLREAPRHDATSLRGVNPPPGVVTQTRTR